MRLHTQVGIVGAGPAGLMLAHLLQREGVESIVVEARSRAYCEERIRAGVLEAGTVDLMNATGVGERMQREGLVHQGVKLRFGGHTHRIDFVELTGKAITVYGQHEVVKDLIAARLGAGAEIVFEASNVSLHKLLENSPTIHFRDKSGIEHEVQCDFIAGCDGFHGVCRAAIPAALLSVYERILPFAWLGVLAESPPVSEELIYTQHARGFALMSMRTPKISRLYLQCAPGDDIAQWPDERFWLELDARLEGADAPRPLAGTVLQKGITAMRSFVVEPMRYGRMFLAGDAAHIVPPTGAKGMNLAIADVYLLARAFGAFFRSRSTEALDRYSETALRRVWRAVRFSVWMTRMLHRADALDPFEERLQRSELDYVTHSRAGALSLAENYVGFPLD